MLDRLPDELLVMVCRSLAVRPTQLHKNPYKAIRPVRNNWRGLAGLCRTCKHLRRIAEPLLYQNYAKPDTVLDPSLHYQFRAFLRTILKRPELGRCLRSLHIGAWPHEGSQESLYCEMQAFGDHEEDQDAFDDPGQELICLYVAHARKTSIKGHHQLDWIDDLEFGDEVAEITLLLAVATNLEYLEFAMPNFANSNIVDVPFLFPKLLGPPSKGYPLKNLKTLFVYKNDTEHISTAQTIPLDEYPGNIRDSYPISPFLPFLNLPNLQHFGAVDSCQTYNTPHDRYPACRPKSSKVQHITLQHCNLSPEVLDHLVSRCSKLESFRCHFAEDRFETIAFSWDNIGRVLYSQRHSLQALELDCENMSQLAYEDPIYPLHPEGTLRPIGSLKNFTALTHVNARSVVLLGLEEVCEDGFTPARSILRLTEVLPPNLEHLTIENCTLFAVPHLEEILASLPGGFPRLRLVSAEPVDLNLGDPDVPPEQDKTNLIRLAQLRQGFRDAGIQWITASTQQPEDGEI